MGEGNRADRRLGKGERQNLIVVGEFAIVLVGVEMLKYEIDAV
jgi:hypothetical protein